MKGILFIIDGLGDLPVPGLADRTPLEAAATPTLDRLAREGECGLIDPIAAGVLPNTHTGVGLLLGMSPEQAQSLRRGPVEAAGLGLRMEPGDVALRANFATLEPLSNGFGVVDRRAGRIREGTAELAEAINRVDMGGDIALNFCPTEQHRGVLVLSGPGLDARVSDTDPGDHGSDRLQLSRPQSPGSEATAELINRFSAEVFELMSAHPLNSQRARSGLPPANGIILRGAGHPVSSDNHLTRNGLSAAVVAGCNTVKGLGRLAGFRLYEHESLTADVDTNLQLKLNLARDALDQHDVVFIHIKAPDILAHDRDPAGKRDFIQRIDQALESLAGQGHALAVTADHTTDSNSGRHTADPVPAIIYRPGTRMERGANELEFGERACRPGSLTGMNGPAYLERFISAVSRDRIV